MNKVQSFFIETILCLSITIFCSFTVNAQSIPDFKIELTSGKMFTTKDLSKSKPTIIIYFAPDCEHCQVLIKGLLKQINAFKKSQIILASFESLQQVSAFEKEYGLKAYPFIKTGIEKPVFFFRYHYHLENTPFTALYDKNGKYVVSYKKQTPVADLIKHLNALK